jgi:hypothetical protein
MASNFGFGTAAIFCKRDRLVPGMPVSERPDLFLPNPVRIFVGLFVPGEDLGTVVYPAPIYATAAGVPVLVQEGVDQDPLA